MEKDWLQLEFLIRRTGLAGTSVRRYIQQYPQFIPSKKEGAQTLFHAEAGAVLRRIAELSPQKLGRRRIEEMLAEEFKPIFEVTKPDPIQAAVAAIPSGGGELVVMLGKMFEVYSEGLKTNARILEALLEQNALLRQRFEAQIEATSSGQRELAAVPAEPPGEPLDSWERLGIITRVLELRRQRLSINGIIVRLKRERIPTLSGRGSWGSGSVRRILRDHGGAT